jgi:predicted transcriptional regulator
MVHGPLLILSAALALQVPEPGSTALDRRKSELIQQIEAAAAAEQPVFGIDTQILAASVLKGHDDAHAARFLGDAAQRTLLLADAATRAHFLKRIAELLAPLDARRAESLCASQSRRPPGQEADPLAVCYDQLIAGLKDWDQGREAFARALAAGAYNLSSAERLLNEARDSHTADFTPLLASFVDAFPARPEADEIARLETVAEAWRRTEPALIRQALARCRAARAALARRSGQAADAKGGPKEPASPLAAATPEEESSSKLKLNFNFDFDLGFGSGKDVEDPQLKGLPEIANLPLDAALALARSQTYAGARAAMLADILDTRSAELDSTRWAWLAGESLRESGAMRTSGDRLILLAELALWCYQHGEKALAATAAQSLATSFDALVQCGDASCAIFRNGGAPGTLIMLFAEYLRKNNIEPADLGLHHPGLQSRWLLFELDALFEDKSGKKDQPEKKDKSDQTDQQEKKEGQPS